MSSTPLVRSVSVFECNDGSTRKTRVEALKHNQFLEIRGLFQGNSSLNITTSEASKIVLDNYQEIKKVVEKYNRAIVQCKEQPKVESKVTLS